THTAGKKSLVEGLAVQLFGIGQRAIDIENEGIECAHRRPPTNARAWVSFLHSSRRQIMGVKMSCMARSILPPGHTMVFGRDMKESCNMDNRYGKSIPWGFAKRITRKDSSGVGMKR